MVVRAETDKQKEDFWPVRSDWFLAEINYRFVCLEHKGDMSSCHDLTGDAKETVELTDLDKYSIQMPYLLFTPYHLM